MPVDERLLYREFTSKFCTYKNTYACLMFSVELRTFKLLRRLLTQIFYVNGKKRFSLFFLIFLGTCSAFVLAIKKNQTFLCKNNPHQHKYI